MPSTTIQRTKSDPIAGDLVANDLRKQLSTNPGASKTATVNPQTSEQFDIGNWFKALPVGPTDIQPLWRQPSRVAAICEPFIALGSIFLISWVNAIHHDDFNAHGRIHTSLACLTNEYLSFLELYSTDSNIHCLRFSETNEYLAVGLGSGTIQVYHTSTNELLFLLKHELIEVNVPVTCIAWRPVKITSTAQNDSPACIKDILVGGYPDGDLLFWHATTGRKLTKLNETDNQVFTVEYSPDGVYFATAGSDCSIRIYNEAKKEVIQKMAVGVEGQATGHSNRIFCLKWHPTNSNILVSSGWDSTIQIWDRSTGLSIRSIFGPHICGEALDFDITGKFILSGSHSIENSLTIHSLDTPPLEDRIKTSMSEDRKLTFVYSAGFSPSNKFFYAAGGHGPANSNELKLFLTQNKTCVGHVHGFPGPIFSGSMTRDDKKLALGGAFPYLILLNVETSNFVEIMY